MSAYSDLAVQRFRELPGDPVQVLRPRAGELVHPAQVRPGVGQDLGHHPGDVGRGDRVGPAPAERQLDPAPVADGRAGEGQEGVEEDGRPDGDDRRPSSGIC